MPTQLLQTGVLEGCDITAQTVPDITLNVAAGSILLDGVPVQVAAGAVTVTTADATQDRIDTVVVDSAGVKSVIAGPINDGANAQPPDTTGYVPLLPDVYVINQAAAMYTGTIVADALLPKRERLPVLQDWTFYTELPPAGYPGRRVRLTPANSSWLDRGGSVWKRIDE